MKTLKEMIDAPQGEYDAVKAAYWAGQSMGRAEAYKAAQEAISELCYPRIKHIRNEMLKRVQLDRSNKEQALEILSFQFEM